METLADYVGSVNKKTSAHKRIRKKRTPIPVATPKVPSLTSMKSGEGIVGLNYGMKEDKNWRMDPNERGEIFLLGKFEIKIFKVYFLFNINLLFLYFMYYLYVLLFLYYCILYSCFITVSSESPDSSESSDPEHNSRSRSKQYLQAAAHLQKRFGNSIPHQHLAATLQHPFNLKHMTHDMFSTHCKYLS